MQTAKEMLMQAQIAKIGKLNPNAVPLYITINSLNSNQSVEQPITLCNKTTIVSDFLKQIRKKYPKYEHVYFFGREKEEDNAERAINPSSKQAKKKRPQQPAAVPERILAINQEMLAKSLQEMHQCYKDNHGLLIVIVSQISLLKPKARPLSEIILFFLAILFAAAYLYLTFSEQPAPKSETQLDYIV